MKRWILTIFLFLLLGAIVNVAVAWTLALVQRSRVVIYGTTIRYIPKDALREPCWNADVHHRPGACYIEGFAWNEVPADDEEDRPGWSITATRPTDRDVAQRVAIEEYARGWPMLSHYCRWSCTRNSPYVLERGLWVPGLAKRRCGNEGRVVPLAVIWPGFVVNTLFYAAVLWLLIPGPFVLRRMIRRKHGRCPKCGYDLRGQPPEVGAAPGKACPECGWNRPPEVTA
ncbi:MAG: hypothetical protein SYC29_03620 [Planctomycetota bacterium]|nr:hypothetical protein [Planctomycetota bacterium]